MSKILAAALCSASLAACGGSGGGGDSDSEGCGAVVGDGNEQFATPTVMTGTVDDSVNGAVASGQGTGADPFDIFVYDVPTAGDYTVTLTWDNAGNDLDLEVYNLAVDNSDPIDRSVDTNTDVEEVEDLVLNGGDQLHLLVLAWNTGCNAQNYTLTIE